jgi:BCD family chlorophyll transporter-like MFS transporter
MLMANYFFLGLISAVIAFALIGLGVGAAGTSLLALLASRVDDHRRPAAATIVWVMMIAGFVITAGVAGAHLDPFSLIRMVTITAIVAASALVVAILALHGIEQRYSELTSAQPNHAPKASFSEALSETWNDPKARQFTVFVFVSMLAYSAQDLILEPFAGTVFSYTPGESTQLSGVQHAGVLLGMVFVAIFGTMLAKRRGGTLKPWCVGGCIASAAALLLLASAGMIGQSFPLREAVFFLGLANGVFAVAAIGSMMALAGGGNRQGQQREGIRMGVWGAAQAVAFGLGGLAGTVAIDITRSLIPDAGVAYTVVFSLQAMLFIISANLAYQLGNTRSHKPALRANPLHETGRSG